MTNRIIRNPEHYFNRYIACEIKNDRKRAAEICEAECSLNEKLEAGEHPRELICNLYGELFDNAAGFLGSIANRQLHAALLMLSAEQLELIRMVYEKRLTQREIAGMLGISQFSVHSRLQTVIRRLKKFFQSN